MNSIEEQRDHWRVQLHPIPNMQNWKTLNYVYECSKALGEQYPTVPITITLSQQSASEHQYVSVYKQLLETWGTICSQIQERIQIHEGPMADDMMEALGTRSAYERARRELERLTETELSQETLLRLRNSRLFGAYLQALDAYRQRKQGERDEQTKSVGFYQDRGRCHAYAALITDLSVGFRLPGTVSLSIE